MAPKPNLPDDCRRATGITVTSMRYRMAPRHRERGAFAIMSVPLLVLIVILCGLALATGQLYNRKVELSGITRAVALAAAKELNGTSAGIISAQTKAKQTAELFTYQYGVSIIWNDAALTFSTTPARTGDWRPSSGISDASAYYFAKVDISGLDVQVSTVHPLIMPIFSSALSTITVNSSAVAGRASINAIPVAICAMSDIAADQRSNTGLTDNELVEYGFRRGVSYDLMRLNPKDITPARFLINPVAGPGMSSSSFDISISGPFACTGTMWMPELQSSTIHVTSLPSTSPLNSVYVQLNSRFDDYTGNLCSPNSAPPDTNVMPYPNDVNNGARWMNPTPGSRAAVTTTERGRLETVADIPPPGSTITGLSAASFGPLWAYTKAVKYSATVPSGGYTPFTTGDWGKLYYKTGLSAQSNYQNTPYSPPVGTLNPGTISSPSPSRKNFATSNSRVLYVPLLSCKDGVPSGSNVTATVAGIGKFFMTVPATADTLIAEFAGAVQGNQLTGQVELYP
ncbi:pilus assembly protein TadE [Massilia sp. LXY-6]|uniref:pilus assembly protein TadG-related protein n=1 Tax=Massilia sp. LXY-6 TaxID=3379823 RepID=UPI003EDFAFE3